jgi:DNA-binding beta-propeller fold protein YncE
MHRRIKSRALSSALLRTLALALGGSIMLSSMTGCASTSNGSAVQETPESFSFWPLAPDSPKIQFVKSYQSSGDVHLEKQSDLARIVFGEQNEQDSEIKKPYGVAMRAGKIYVCDIRRPALAVLDLVENQVRLVGVRGVNRLTHPVDVTVADDGWIYVADNDRNAVLVYDPNERYAKTIGRRGMKPVSVAVHGDRLYVCDLTAQQVEIFDRRTGDPIGKFGSAGDEDGQFRVPISVSIDRDGNVYVSDMMRARMQKFTPDGEYLDGFGELGDYAGSFARPKQLAVDSEGIIYVVDAAFQNVQMFNDEHALLMSFGAAGSFPGAMNLPAGICVTDERLDLYQNLVHPGFEIRRLIAVTNQFGQHKVSVYALGDLREGWTLDQIHATSDKVSAGVGMNDAVTPLQSFESPDAAPGSATEPPPPPPAEDGDADGGDGVG